MCHQQRPVPLGGIDDVIESAIGVTATGRANTLQVADLRILIRGPLSACQLVLRRYSFNRIDHHDFDGKLLRLQLKSHLLL
jgi:hypothetical protein